jgi:uncharacterized protein (TIGR02246 family)
MFRSKNGPVWRGLLCTVAFVLVGYAGQQLGAQVTMPQTEEPAVKKVITDFADAWNNHDAKAMADLHTEDVNFINIFGQWWKGRNEVEEGLRRGHSAPFAKSKMLINIEQVRFLAPNVAVVHGTMELVDAPPETLGRCHSIRVLVKANGKWLISSFQNTLIRAGDPAARKE